MRSDMIQQYAKAYRAYRIRFHKDYDLEFTVKCAVENIVSSYGKSSDADFLSCISGDIEDLERAVLTGVA